MPAIVIVEKSGSLKSLQNKNYVESDLYKKAGFKTANDFELQTVWTIDAPNGGVSTGTIKQYSVHLYAKTAGRAGQENKYDFPPPVDKVLFFGNCILVNKPAGIVDDLTVLEWEYIYNKLFGGFDEIGGDDETEEESVDSIKTDNVSRTKNGYVKDGFVIDDDEIETEPDDEDYEEQITIKPKPKAKATTKLAAAVTVTAATTTAKTSKPKTKINNTSKLTKTNKKKNNFITQTTENNSDNEIKPETNLYLDCTNELTEEEYIPMNMKL